MKAPSYQDILENQLFPQLRRGAIAVTGTVRLARRIRHRYGLWRSASGASVWRRPGVLPWGEWLRSLWEESLLSGGRAGEFSLLSEHGSLLLWERTLGQSDGDLLHLGQQAELARGSWNLALKYGLTSEQLLAELQGEDEERFAVWVRAFEESREEKNWLEPAALPALLSQDAQQGALRIAGPLFFLGMEDQWTPPGEQLLATLQQAGVTVLPTPAARHTRQAVHTAFDSSAEELEAAARWTGAANSGVVLLDFSDRAGEARHILLDQMQPGWQTRGFPLAAPLNSAQAQGLAEAGPPEAALTALRLLPREFEFQHLSRVLRGGYLRGSREEAAARAQLERKVRGRLLGARLGRGQLTRLALQEAPVLAEALQQGWKLARQARGQGRRRPHRIWGSVFTVFLQALGWPGNRPRESDEDQALRAWRQLLSEFGACDAVFPQPVALEEALDRLEAMARRRGFQPQGPDEAVELLPIQEAAGMHFDRLWVAGAGASLWPRRNVNPAPFLPLRLQERLGIPGASPQASLKQARRQTSALLAAGEEVVFSWTRAAAEGVDTTLSPLVATLGLEEQEAQPVTESSYVQALQGSAKLEPLESDDAPALGEDEELTGGVHLMDQQLNCPFRAFAQFRLHAKEYPEPWDGVHPMDRGNLLHALLQRLYSDCGNQETLPGAMDDLKQRLEQWASELPKSVLLGHPALRRGLLRMERARAVELALELIGKDGGRPYRIELLEEPAALELGPIELSMRLDRVESLGEEGGCLVLDYKTGGNKFSLGHLNPAKLRSSQLAAYALATEGALGVGYVYLNENGIEFQGMHDDDAMKAGGEATADGIKPLSSTRLPRFETWQELLDAWRDTLERAANRLAEGDAGVQMHRGDGWARGQYQVLSRIHELEAAPRTDAGAES